MLPPPPSEDLIRLPQTLAGIASGASVRCPYIKTLRIQTPFNRNLKPGILKSSLIAHLVQKLPKLHSLQLVDVVISSEDVRDTSLFSLESLELRFEERMVAHPIAAIIAALRLFSHIQSLSITIEYLADRQQEQQSRLALPVQVIGYIELEGMLPTIRALQRYLKLDSSTTVSLRPYAGKWVELKELGLIIRDVSPQLVSLAITTGLFILDYRKSNDTCKSLSYSLSL